jgi:hypothetical protein
MRWGLFLLSGLWAGGAQAQYTLIESGTENDILCIREMEGRLYFLGHRYLARTDDLGETIQLLNVPDELPFTYSLNVMDTSTFYLISAHHFPVLDYRIMKTEDGGTTWETVYDTTGTTINSMTVSRSGRIMAVGNFGRIFRSQDQVDWTVSQIGMMTVPTQCQSVNDTTYLIGGFERLGVSYNFGGGWYTRYLEKSYPNEFALIGQDTIYVTSYFHNWYKSYISRSYDGGHSWNTIFIADHIGIYDSHFMDKDHGFAVGYDHLNSIGVLLETHNAGNTWYRHHMPYNSKLYNVKVVNDTILFAAGTNGVLFRTDLNALPTSQPQIDAGTIRMGPNPVGVNEEFWIRSILNERMRLTIYDGLGRVVMGREFVGSNWIAIDVPGCYHLELMWNGGSHMRKVIVQ